MKFIKKLQMGLNQAYFRTGREYADWLYSQIRDITIKHKWKLKSIGYSKYDDGIKSAVITLVCDDKSKKLRIWLQSQARDFEEIYAYTDTYFCATIIVNGEDLGGTFDIANCYSLTDRLSLFKTQLDKWLITLDQPKVGGEDGPN